MTPAPIVALISLIIASTSVLANVPVNDAAILERKAQESTHKSELKSVILDQKQKRDGIKCAVTKGGRGQGGNQVRNNESQPNPVTGSNALQKYAPEMPAAPQPGVTGGALSEQQLGAETGRVISGVEATQGTGTATTETYRTRSGEVGKAKTVMEAFDENSSMRIQNGMTWNQTIATANLLVQALNALNLANQSETSQGATALTGFTQPRPRVDPGRTCPTGFSGAGTTADPCRPSMCSTTPTGTPADPACITRRYVDSDGNVRIYLELATRLVIETRDAAAANRPYQTITEAELIEALAARRHRATGKN